MDEKRPHYLMNKLMNCHELDAFAAQKKAGSSGAYFDLLTEFVDTAPAATAVLTAPSDAAGLTVFLNAVHDIQKQLLSVGATPLLWLAEKMVESARSGNKVKCEDEILVLDNRIKQLCGILEEARTSEPGGRETSPRPDAAAQPAPRQAAADRPKAPVKLDLFEKLKILIENFELEDAMAALHTLRSFTYGDTIDTILNYVHADLAAFNYDKAQETVNKLLNVLNKKTNELTKKKILAIDDVPDILTTVKAVLKDEYTVYCVTNHMAALKFLTANTADLILLDIEMPDMNGFALLGIIRKIKAYDTTPVIFLTGNVNTENIKTAARSGGSDFVRKPVEADVLLAKIRKHIG